MPPQQEKPKMTLYHGELRAAGPTRVKVLKGVQESAKKKGTFYVDIEFQGCHRYYNPENQACLDFWADKPAGSEFDIVADGSRDDASIVMVGEPQDASVNPRSMRAPEPTPQPKPQPAPRVQAPTPHVHSPAAAPAKADAVWKPDGMEVGMCLKEGCALMRDSGISPLEPEFFHTLHELTSDLLRLSRHLRAGNLADPIKKRKAASGQQGGAQ